MFSIDGFLLHESSAAFWCFQPQNALAVVDQLLLKNPGAGSLQPSAAAEALY